MEGSYKFLKEGQRQWRESKFSVSQEGSRRDPGDFITRRQIAGLVDMRKRALTGSCVSTKPLTTVIRILCKTRKSPKQIKDTKKAVMDHGRTRTMDSD